MSEYGFVFCRQRRVNAMPDGRFEYRIWSQQPHPAVAALQSGWPLTGSERRADIYLVTAASNRALVKLRNGTKIEVKRRGSDQGLLQSWNMPLSQSFPLSVADLALLAGSLCLRERFPPDAGLSPAHLLAQIDEAREPVRPCTVRKSRLLFTKGFCRAEICRLQIGKWSGLTIALESHDFPAISAALEALQLTGLPNRSYGDALVQLVEPAPRGAANLRISQQ